MTEDDSTSPKIRWDDDPMASLLKEVGPQRKLDAADEVFIEQTLRMITENANYKGFLVMHDPLTDRMRYICFNGGGLLGSMSALGRVFARLAELAQEDPESR